MSDNYPVSKRRLSVAPSNSNVRQVVLWASILKFGLFSAFASFLLYSYPFLLIAAIIYQALEWQISGVSRQQSNKLGGTYQSSRSNGRALLLISSIIGILVGLANFELFWVQVEYFDQSQAYRDIVPTINAKSLADASQIRFATSAHIDRARSTGFKLSSNEIYCIAPIVETGAPTVGKQVQFYAVGMNCCQLTGTFDCDDANVADVHSGAVVPERGLLLNHPEIGGYVKARRKLEAIFGVPENEDSMLVRWKKDPYDIRNSYKTVSLLVYFSSIAVFGIFIFLTRNAWA